jgi:sec-independent protein translocase protein TatA
MGFGIKELVVVMIIVLLVFGTKKLRGVGGDVGGWIRDFRNALREAPVADAGDLTPGVGELIEEEARVEKEKA